MAIKLNLFYHCRR